MTYELKERTEKYATVVYTDDVGKTVHMQLRVISMSEIKALVDSEKNVNLDKCYIDNFDIKELFVDEKCPILKSFSAKGSFFAGRTNFFNVRFDDNGVDLSGAIFENGDLYFMDAQFGDGEIKFIGAKFINVNVSFDGANFGSGVVSFRDAQFENSKLNFRGTKFASGDVIFRSNFKSGYVNFTEVDFSINKIKIYRTIAKDANFIFRKCIFHNNHDFLFTEIKRIVINDCIIFGTINMENDIMSVPVKIEELTFWKTKNLGSIFISWGTAKYAISKYLLDEAKNLNLLPLVHPPNITRTQEEFKKYETKETNWLKKRVESIKSKRLYLIALNIQKADQMKMLKENYHNLGEYEWEDETFGEYMRYKRKAEVKMCKKFPNWLIDIIGVYATKPARVALVMFCTWFVFGVIFGISALFGGIEVSCMLSPIQKILQGFYFSAITFLTIGYGDISPLAWWTQILAPLEGFLGLFLMSYFTVAVVRKTLR